MKLTINIAYKIAEDRNGICLSKIFLNNRTKLKWQCHKKHVWFADLNHIKDGNTWCPYCRVDKIRLDGIVEAIKIANCGIVLN